MPVYNGARFLGDALGSLKRQEPFEGGYEILAADDGSADRSPEILREALAGGLPIRVLDGARRGNWVASTNKALREARGDWIVFLHQDDRYRPSRLRRLSEAIAASPGRPFFVNDAVFIDVAGRPLGNWRAPIPAGYSGPAAALPPLLVQNNFSVPGVAFRRSLLDDVGYPDEGLRYAADWDYWARIVSRRGVVRIGARLSEFRVHHASQTVADFARHRDAMRSDLEQVAGRNLRALAMAAPRGDPGKWTRLARLGVEVDLFLACGAAGGRLPWDAMLAAARKCRLRDCPRYLFYSRIFPRVLARLRAGLRKNGAGAG